MKPTRFRADIAFTTAVILCAVALPACDAEPPCWKDVRLGSTYHVSLAAKASPNYYAVGSPSRPPCTGIDSLDAGVAVDIEIPPNSAHAEYDRGQCWVPEGVITSDVGLPLVPVDGLALMDIGYGAEPMFTRSAEVSIGDCMGEWHFTAIDDPGDAHNGTPAHRWVGRVVQFDATAACQAAFPDIVAASGALCYDEWDIDVQTR